MDWDEEGVDGGWVGCWRNRGSAGARGASMQRGDARRRSARERERWTGFAPTPMALSARKKISIAPIQDVAIDRVRSFDAQVREEKGGGGRGEPSKEVHAECDCSPLSLEM